MLPLIVIGSGICASIVVTELTMRNIPIRWFTSSDVVAEASESAIIPGLLVPSDMTWPDTSESRERILLRFEDWLQTLSDQAIRRVRFSQLNTQTLDDHSAPIPRVGVIDIQALTNLLQERAQQLGLQQEQVSSISYTPEGTSSILLRVNNQSIYSQAIIEALPLHLQPQWHIVEQSDIVQEDTALMLPLTSNPALWTWIYPLNKQNYVDGNPEVAQSLALRQLRETTGLRGYLEPGSSVVQVTPQHVRVHLTSGMGLLEAPELTAQILAVLGITPDSKA